MFKVNLVRGSWKVMSWMLMLSMVVPTIAIGDLSIAYAAPTALYQNDFESGIGSWTSASGTVDTSDVVAYTRSCPGDFSVCSDGDNDYLRFNNDSSVIKSITTTGYQDITLKYWRYAYSLEGNDRIKVSWRVGTTTSWSSLESTVGSAGWVSKSFLLAGSGNQSTIQFKLELKDAEDDDYALFDDVQVLAEEQLVPDGISILNINGDTQPFDYSCPNNPPANPVTITGSGAGSAPPGQIEQYAVQLDWGDGNQTNGLGLFTPNSGQGNFTFTFSAGPHEYATSGNFIITARLYHSQPPGQDNQADAVATISICITIAEEPEPTYCGDGIVQNPNDDQVVEECDGQAGVGLHQSCDQGCQLVDLTYCGDDIKQTPNTEATGGPLNDGYESCDGTDGVGAHEVCSETCVLTSLSYCGDGQVQDPNDEQGTEQCDGQTGVGPHQSCDESCQLVNQTYCGDGQIQNPNDEQVAEECDDGPDGSQTCSTSCESLVVPVCGNGTKEGAEQCDDSNLADNDGCSANCTLETMTCEGIHESGNGWYGRYYNYYATHPDMNLQNIYWPDAGHGDPEGTWDTDWYENEYFRFSRVDSSLTFGEDFFPFDIAPESAGPDDIFNGHDFHFGVHWSGVAKVTTTGQHTFELVSDDDAWVYVDGVLVMANPGIHAPASTSTIVTLTGANIVDIYFAERQIKRSHFSFNWVTEGVTVDPYNTDCPECGNYITEEDGQEECDAGPNGSETCSVECTNIIPEFCGDGVKTESEQCDDSNNADGDGCSANCSLEQLTCEDTTDEDSGWFARYYNYYATHPDMNLQMGVYWPDDGHGDPLGSWDTDWYDNQYFRFSRVDSSLTFGEDFFPFDIAPESAGPDDIFNGHDFHFGVHWSAIATVSTPGVYNVELASDDDAWVYVDGVLQADAPGIHAVETEIVALTLTGHNVIDIYYAERHVEKAVFSLTWLSDGVELTPYNSECPECGNYITEAGNEEECDAGPNGSESCTVECTSLVTTNICGYKWNDLDGNQSRDEEPGLPDWTIQLLQFSSCEPGDEWADAVTSFSQGNRKNGTNVLAERSDTSKTLGAAQNNDTINFLALGFGGEVVLQFNNIIVNGVGDDLQIVETSYGSPSCASYPETAHVYASKDGVSWTDLGTGCLDETYDLGSLPWAQYVKIVDISNVLSSNFPADADGFDIDAVKALNCAGGWDIVASTTTDEEGNYCFEDLQPDDYRVQEQMQQGWVNTTSLFEDLTLAENEQATVNFGNKTSSDVDEGSICGYKFNDLNHNGTFDEGEEGIPEWHIFATGDTNTDTWTNGSGRYCFNGLVEGVWSIFEELVSGWATSTAATTTVNFSGTGIDNINFGNFMCVDSDEDGYNVGGGLCGQVDCNDQNGSINPGEAEVCNEVDDNCDGQIDEGDVCNEEPPIIITTGIGGGGGGGGGGNPQFLSIHTESSLNSCEPTVSVTVSWFTNQASDSRVVYDTVSHNVVGGAPNYGYANSTGTTDEGAGVTFHTVIIGGLSANTTYYFRAVSEKSNVEVYGSEMSTSVICDEGTPPQGPSAGPTGPGIVAGVETGPENNEGGIGGGNDSGSQGQVQGVEFAEAAENDATSTPTLPVGGEQNGGSATTDDEATPLNCVVYLWILIVLNALAMVYLKMKGKDAKNFWLHNSWWILALIVVLALIIWYAACWLVILLIATLVVAIVTPFVIKEQA